MSTLLQNLPPLSLAPVVAKPPTINSRRQRPSPSTGQQAVFAFLKRKHESYLRRLSLLRDGASTVPVGRNTWDLPDRELAEHVVHCAKVKLLSKRDKKSFIPAKRKYSTVSTKNVDTSHKITTQKLASDRSKCVKTDCCTFKASTQSCNLENPAQLSVIDNSRCILENRTEPRKSTVMYFSQIHSSNPHQAGQVVMDVLPTTPKEEFSKLCLHSHEKSQTPWLEEIATKFQPKAPLKNVTIDASNRECDNRLKAEQRAEIYALNEVMTKLEEENFQSHISAKV